MKIKLQVLWFQIKNIPTVTPPYSGHTHKVNRTEKAQEHLCILKDMPIGLASQGLKNAAKAR